MTDSIGLNILVLLFLLLTLKETNFKPRIREIQKTGSKISPVFLLIFIILGTLFILFFLTTAPKNFVSWYLKIILSLLVFGHALWLSINKNLLYKLLFVAVALLFITARFYYPTSVLHNVLLILGILWLGPFFIQTKLMTVKRFIIISIFWFIYDIFFVWFTSSSRQILYTTKAIDFPLSVNFAKSSIGIADLFWAGFLLSLLKKRKIKLISIILLICSNLLLGIYAIYITHISVFPLLVIWVPIGIFFVFYENQNKGHLF